MRVLLSGNEAIALGAYHAGVSLAAAYPGTPSTEILETIARWTDLHAEWAPNEKVAMEVAMGASYAGVRALVSMKHVGLNVAADPFFAAAITGVRGGLVVVSADDPGMHSSQNEQDNRHYARFAKVPVLEPADSQEAYDLTKLAFSLSEQFDTPVLLRSTTRVSHSKSVVDHDDVDVPARPRPTFVRNPEKYVMIPAYARQRHPKVEDRITRLAEYAEGFPHNQVEWQSERLGVIAVGVGYQYAREVVPWASFLKLGMGYPLPSRKIRDFAARVERLMVVEELDPFLEEQVRSLGLQVEGKRFFPPVGELSLERVEAGFSAAGIPVGQGPVPCRPRDPFEVHRSVMLSEAKHLPEPREESPSLRSGQALRCAFNDIDTDSARCHSRYLAAAPPGTAQGDKEKVSRCPDGCDNAVPLPARPPVLCPGCPHTGAFFVLKKLGFYRGDPDVAESMPSRILGRLRRTGVVVAGDIGCYTLSVLPPLLAIDTTGCMGASIGNAMGMQKAGLPNKVVAVIGDSTFLHSGITPLLDVVYNGGTVTTLILDNSTTAMTGHQEHPGTGLSAQGRRARAVDLEALVRAVGVEDVKVANAFDLAAVEAAIQDSVERDEPSVVIVRGACSLKVKASGTPYSVDSEKCDGCSTCLRLGCPAIARHDGKARIDPALCVGSDCDVCRQVCPLRVIGVG